MITTSYRVVVDVPEEVWERYGGTQMYDSLILKATEGNVSAGSNSCSEVEEWAEFTTMYEAKACEQRLRAAMDYLTLRLNDED